MKGLPVFLILHWIILSLSTAGFGAQIVSGTVFDSVSGARLDSVSVQLMGDPARTSTDAQGSFSLVCPAIGIADHYRGKDARPAYYGSVELYDLTGKLVYRAGITAGENGLLAGGLRLVSGVYQVMRNGMYVGTMVSLQGAGQVWALAKSTPESPGGILDINSGAALAKVADSRSLLFSKPGYAAQEIGVGTNDTVLTVQLLPATRNYIVPDTGFTGPTPQPDTIGTPGDIGYNANTMAHWDVVPYQTFAVTMNVGVVAFHSNGIDRVSFSVNGGAWTHVAAMALNAQVANTSGIGKASPGVVEYFATLRAADFPDGPVEVRAIAYPRVGVPKLLEPLFLNANHNGTLAERFVYVSTQGDDATADGSRAHPYKTMLAAATYNTGGAGHATIADNLTIYCEEGDYAWPSATWNMFVSTNRSWLTVTSAPGADRARVRITTNPVSGSSGFYTYLLRLKNLTIGNGALGIELTTSNDGVFDHFLCLENIEWIGPGPGNDAGSHGQLVNGFNRTYYIDSYVHATGGQVRNGILVRGVLFENGSVAFSNPQTIINCEARNLYVPAGTDFHTDVAQYYNTTSGWGGNIIYGLTAIERPLDAQGIVFGPAGFRDIAVVNCNVGTGLISFAAQSGNYGVRNLYMQGNIFGSAGWLDNLGQAITVDDTREFIWENVVLENNVFPSGCNLNNPYPGVTIR